MRCTVRSASRIVFDGEAERIVARSPHGEFAVLEGHAPLLAVLVPGVVRLMADGQDVVIVCRGGTVDAVPGKVTLLVEDPYTLDEIDTDAVQARLAELHADGSAQEDAHYLQLLCEVKDRHA